MHADLLLHAMAHHGLPMFGRLVDLLDPDASSEQMYARDIKYLAEWILDPSSTDGSGLSAAMYATLTATVDRMRAREGLARDTHVVYHSFILHGAPGNALRSLWIQYLIEAGVTVPGDCKVSPRCPGGARQIVCRTAARVF